VVLHKTGLLQGFSYGKKTSWKKTVKKMRKLATEKGEGCSNKIWGGSGQRGGGAKKGNVLKRRVSELQWRKNEHSEKGGSAGVQMVGKLNLNDHQKYCQMRNKRTQQKKGLVLAAKSNGVRGTKCGFEKSTHGVPCKKTDRSQQKENP